MSPNESPSHHRFFILGLRLHAASRPGEYPRWRISLEDPTTTDRSGFRTLAELTTFLQAWMDEKVKTDGDA